VHTPDRGGPAGSQHGLPQSAADPATRRRRTGHRAAQDPLESATPHPPMSSANRRHRRGPTCPDQRRAANPLNEPR
jgi:hypothetical protein